MWGTVDFSQLNGYIEGQYNHCIMHIYSSNMANSEMRLRSVPTDGHLRNFPALR